MGRVVRGANCPWGGLSMGRVVIGRVSWGEMPWGEMSWGELSGISVLPCILLLLYPRTMLPLLPPPCLLSTDLPLHPVCPLQLSWSILLTARVIRLNVQRRIVCTMYIHCAYNDIHMRTFLNYVFHPTKRTRPSPRRCP
jgi:hypothetical protein